MDPILSLVVCLLILVSAIRLLGAVTRVLMEGVPQGISSREVGLALAEIDGVIAVHDLHIWSLSSTSHALAAHVDLEVMAEWQGVLPQMQALLRDRFGIEHSTLQPEDAQIRLGCVIGQMCSGGERGDSRHSH